MAEPKKSFNLGNGLEVWLVGINDPIEQDINARAMPQNMFYQLVDNIKERDGALESLPFCAVTDKGLEIVSGHHRKRAAKKAGMSELWVLVDTSNLSNDKIRSKQLAHNSIQGKDNSQIMADIFNSIEDAEAKIRAFIDVKVDDIDFNVPLDTRGLDIELDSKTATILFLPSQLEVFKKTLDQLKAVSPDEVFLASKKDYDKLIEAMDASSLAFNITSTPTLLAKMSEIVMEHIANGDYGKESEA